MSTALSDLCTHSPNQSLTASIIRNVLNSIRSERGGDSSNLWDVREDERATESPFAGYGAISAQGLSKHMEDSFHVQETLNSPGLSEAQIAQSQPLQQQSATEDSFSLSGGFSEDLAFFSVFDGHGGDEVAQHCSDRLHQHFTRLLLSDIMSPDGVADGSGPDSSTLAQDLDNSDELASTAGAVLQQAACSTPRQADGFSRAPEDVADTAAGVASPSTPPCVPHHGRNLSGSRGTSRPCHPSLVTAALRTSFHLTDTELAGTDEGEFVGATAVVAVVGRRHIWVAHCGDSRAVMQRNGDAVALTSDHKPDREDEADRIRAAGGRIVFNGGTRRVNGMLAMTRSIGDHYLRPFVIAEPEVTCMERTAEDEVLIIATDGLWDVFGCTEATHLASRCISRSKERGMPKHGACRVAAAVLANTALERGSRDNITVIVVDVSLPPIGAESGGEGTGGGEPIVASSVQEELEPASSGGAGEGAEDGGAIGAGGAPMQMRSATSMGKYMLLKSQSRGEVGSGSGAGGSSAAAASPRQVCSHADLTRLCSDRQQDDASAASQRQSQAFDGRGGAVPSGAGGQSLQVRQRAAVSGGGAVTASPSGTPLGSPCGSSGVRGGGLSPPAAWSPLPSRLCKVGDAAMPGAPSACGGDSSALLSVPVPQACGTECGKGERSSSSAGERSSEQGLGITSSGVTTGVNFGRDLATAPAAGAESAAAAAEVDPVAFEAATEGGAQLNWTAGREQDELPSPAPASVQAAHQLAAASGQLPAAAHAACTAATPAACIGTPLAAAPAVAEATALPAGPQEEVGACTDECGVNPAIRADELRSPPSASTASGQRDSVSLGAGQNGLQVASAGAAHQSQGSARSNSGSGSERSLSCP